jgi:hypothetical protein
MKSQGFYYIIFVIVLVSFSSVSLGGAGQFELNCPYWYILFDRAGYVDITFWFPSARHEYGPHEMTTGDIAAACWYQGIKNNSTEAQWLTEQFIIPDIPDTCTPFIKRNHSVSNSSSNPVWTSSDQPNPPPYNPPVKADTGWSTLDDGKLQVKIFYEVVDLGQTGYSPISYREPNGTSTYAKSERYIQLLTYQFKNLQATQTIQSLEFFQMLHGHPADQDIGINCMYETMSFTDVLANYTP